MNSFFATVEQQANPRLRGKAVGVTGGDREVRTVLCTASVEAKKRGIKTGMQVWQARQICPDIIIIPGDSDKYLSCTTKFLNILKDYTPYLEVFSIDEAFLQMDRLPHKEKTEEIVLANPSSIVPIAKEIKQRIRSEVGEWITCSIGISYNKLMAKLASGLQKPDGLVVISTAEEAMAVLDKVELDEICGIGPRIKKRLFNLGITNFSTLRQVPKEHLTASFNSFGEVLYNMARGVDHASIKPFYEREEVKSVGHRHTIDHDTASPQEIKQILLKLSELVAARVRKKNLIGKTIHCWYRPALQPSAPGTPFTGFHGDGMQKSLGDFTSDGLDIFKVAWEIFASIWNKEKIRMIGVSVSNVRPASPSNVSFLPEETRKKVIDSTLDNINNKWGDFTLMRGTLLGSLPIKRKPNPFLSDRRFKL